MNILSRLFLAANARTDARHGLNSGDERIIAEQGRQPKLDPVTNPEHGEYARVLADRARIEELREDIARAEESVALHLSPALIAVGLVFTVALEVLGAILIMRALGVQASERLPFGCALALALIGVTAVAAHRTSHPRDGGGGPGSSGAARVARSLFSLVILGSYTLVVLAIAVVRIQTATDEEATQLEILAQAIVMVATSIGPAWFAEWLIRRRTPAVAERKRLKLLRRRLRLAEREYSRAQAAVNRITRERDRWEDQAARRRALYATHHRLATERQQP